MAILYILLAVLIIAAIFFALYLIGSGLEALFLVLPATADTVLTIVLAAAFFVGLNVLGYFASYKWGARKPWFFWLGLVLTLSLFCLVFSYSI